MGWSQICNRYNIPALGLLLIVPQGRFHYSRHLALSLDFTDMSPEATIKGKFKNMYAFAPHVISWLQYHSATKTLNYTFISMVQFKTAVTPLLMHWSYCSIALNHRYIVTTWACYRPPPTSMAYNIWLINLMIYPDLAPFSVLLNL